MKMNKKQFVHLNPCMAFLDFAKACQFDFVIIWNSCENGGWLIWLLRKVGKLDKPTAVRLAIECAPRTLPAFEKKFPSDFRPRQAVAAAEAWLKNPSAAY